MADAVKADGRAIRSGQSAQFDSIETVEAAFARCGYISDRTLATTVFLASSLGKPIFLEGERWSAESKVALSKGQKVRVTAIEGLVVYVEPATTEH